MLVNVSRHYFGVFAMLKRNRSSGNTLTTKGSGRLSMNLRSK